VPERATPFPARMTGRRAPASSSAAAATDDVCASGRPQQVGKAARAGHVRVPLRYGLEGAVIVDVLVQVAVGIPRVGFAGEGDDRRPGHVGVAQACRQVRRADRLGAA